MNFDEPETYERYFASAEDLEELARYIKESLSKDDIKELIRLLQE